MLKLMWESAVANPYTYECKEFFQPIENPPFPLMDLRRMNRELSSDLTHSFSFSVENHLGLKGRASIVPCLGHWDSFHVWLSQTPACASLADAK